MQFNVKIENKDIFKKLNEYGNEIGNLKPLLKLVSQNIKNVIDENFDTEGQYTGEKWEEWSDIWLKKRQEKGKSNGKILNLDGYLRRSIEKYVESARAIIGSSMKYAAIHNFGGDIKRKGKTIGEMPQREFMRIDRVEEEKIIDDLHEFYIKKLEEKIK